jgi:hypothetical protein
MSKAANYHNGWFAIFINLIVALGPQMTALIMADIGVQLIKGGRQADNLLPG